MKYTSPNCIKFVEDMEAAGFEVYHYKGRFFWEGPAVNVKNLQDAISNTEVRCQWDDMGLGLVVYPKSSDKGIEE